MAKIKWTPEEKAEVKRKLPFGWDLYPDGTPHRRFKGFDIYLGAPDYEDTEEDAWINAFPFCVYVGFDVSEAGIGSIELSGHAAESSATAGYSYEEAGRIEQVIMEAIK